MRDIEAKPREQNGQRLRVHREFQVARARPRRNWTQKRQNSVVEQRLEKEKMQGSEDQAGS